MQWFPLAYRLDGRTRYLLWYDDTPERLLLDAAGCIASYGTLTEVVEQAELLHLALQMEPPILHDLDRLAAQLVVLRPSTIACAPLLEAWNLFDAVGASLRWSRFDPQSSRTQKLYEKLFWGSNLPAVTPAGEQYRPIWSLREVRQLRIVLFDGLQLFRHNVVAGEYSMDHADHVALIRGGVPGPGGTWADFGAGGGAFTLALAELLGPTAAIVAVDRDAGALGRLARGMAAQFPAVALETLTADFAGSLALPPLAGAVAANALHFLTGGHREAALAQIRAALLPGAPLIVVEYSLDRGNTWVPHPFTYARWETMAREAGFTGTRLLARRPSRTFAEIYSAVSYAPHGDDSAASSA